MNPEATLYAAALGEAARVIHDESDVDVALDRIVSLAQTSVPGFEHVGVAELAPADRIEARIATGELVRELVHAESRNGEGPCLMALRGSRMVAAPGLRHDQRWPSYVGAAVTSGVQGQLAVRLDGEGDRLGCLAFYSVSSEAISEEAIDGAKMFATVAGLALTQRREVTELEQALVTRRTIGIAMGILMERLGLDEDSAFAFLVRESSQTNLKLRDVAANIVEGTNVSRILEGPPNADRATDAAQRALAPRPPRRSPAADDRPRPRARRRTS